MSWILPRTRVAVRPALIRLQIAALAAGALLCIACPSPIRRPAPLPAEVQSIQPSNQAQLEEPPAAVRARFRTALDAPTLTADWLQVATTVGTVPGMLTVEGEAGDELVWRPVGEWPRSQDLLVTLSPAIRFRDGDRFDRSWSWTFVIAAVEATEFELGTLSTWRTGPAAYDFLAPVSLPGREIAAVWWTTAAPFQQEGAFRATDATWSPPSLLVDTGVPADSALLVAEATQAWLFDPDRQRSIWHQRSGVALSVPLLAPRPYCVSLDDGRTVVWSASPFAAGVDAASHTWDSTGRTWVPTTAVADLGAGLDAYFGVLPFDGQGAQQIVLLAADANHGPRLAALPIATDGSLGTPIELAEVTGKSSASVAVADDDHAAVLLRDEAGGGLRLRVVTFGRDRGWRAPVTLFSGLSGLIDSDLAIAAGGRVLVAVATAMDLRVAEVLADGSVVPAQVLPGSAYPVRARIQANGDALLVVGMAGPVSLLGRLATRGWSLPLALADSGLFTSQGQLTKVMAAAAGDGTFELLLASLLPVSSGVQFRLETLTVRLR